MQMHLRTMQRSDWAAVAALIHDSTNRWYESHGHAPIFTAGPESTRLFCEVYEELDPGGCVVAEDAATGRIAGSCFVHPRETHISLGIMNTHPDWAGKGVAALLLRHITAGADARNLPLRLVSSAFNLDSFSLYSRHGFVPRAIFQDMILTVPSGGVPIPAAAAERLRDARPEDVAAIGDLEQSLHGIRRERDYRYFIGNRSGLWRSSVFVGDDGLPAGFLASIGHPATRMLGPGFARTDGQAAALIARELDRRRGETMVFLVPTDRPALVRACYDLGARNCEIHFAQARGEWPAPAGVILPTFMPETG